MDATIFSSLLLLAVECGLWSVECGVYFYMWCKSFSETHMQIHKFETKVCNVEFHMLSFSTCIKKCWYFFATQNMWDIKQFSVKCSKFLDFSRFLVGEKIQSYEIWGSNVKWKMMVESTHLKTKVRQTLIAQRIHETIPCAHKFRSIYDIVGIPLSYVNKFTTSNSSLS